MTQPFSVISSCLYMLKPGFHYPSWRPELTARVDRWPVSITRQHGPCWRACVFTSRVDGPSRVKDTGHPSTRVVNSGRQLGYWKPGLIVHMKQMLLLWFRIEYYGTRDVVLGTRTRQNDEVETIRCWRFYFCLLEMQWHELCTNWLSHCMHETISGVFNSISHVSG